MDTLTPAEVAQLLGTSPNRVRQLLRDRKLMAVPGSGNGKIPADFVQDGADPQAPARAAHRAAGTAGSPTRRPSSGCSARTTRCPARPVQALRDDRHTEVTRRAQALAL